MEVAYVCLMRNLALAERFRAILGLPSRLTKAATFGVG